MAVTYDPVSEAQLSALKDADQAAALRRQIESEIGPVTLIEVAPKDNEDWQRRSQGVIDGLRGLGFTVEWDCRELTGMFERDGSPMRAYTAILFEGEQYERRTPPLVISSNPGEPVTDWHGHNLHSAEAFLKRAHRQAEIEKALDDRLRIKAEDKARRNREAVEAYEQSDAHRLDVLEAEQEKLRAENHELKRQIRNLLNDGPEAI